MSFSQSSQNIQLIDNHILRAKVRDENGNWRQSEIDLNKFIGNYDGTLQWTERSSFVQTPELAITNVPDFSHSARDVRVVGPALFASVSNRKGEWSERSLDLDYAIGNENGKLTYVGEEMRFYPWE